VQLLEKDPQKRLGTPGCSSGDIVEQPFFKSINWDRLDRKEIEPPFKPKVVTIKILFCSNPPLQGMNFILLIMFYSVTSWTSSISIQHSP
jgi:hypothetical protein